MDWAKLGQAAIKIIPAAVDSIANVGTSIYNTNKTISANKQMAQYAYEKDLAMWNLQNQYNSPASQMQRYKDAGLNPMLIYSQGSSGNASQLPKYQAPKQEFNYDFRPDILGAMQRYQDLSIRQSNADILQEELRKRHYEANQAKRDWEIREGNEKWGGTDKLKSQIAKAESDASYSAWRAENERSKFSAHYWNKKYVLDLERLSALNKKLEADTQKVYVDTDFQKVKAELYPWQFGINTALKALGGVSGMFLTKGLGNAFKSKIPRQKLNMDYYYRNRNSDLYGKSNFE